MQARYIFTRLAPLTRHLFNEADDQLLRYLDEEGQSIEPHWWGAGACRGEAEKSSVGD